MDISHLPEWNGLNMYFQTGTGKVGTFRTAEWTLTTKVNKVTAALLADCLYFKKHLRN